MTTCVQIVDTVIGRCIFIITYTFMSRRKKRDNPPLFLNCVITVIDMPVCKPIAVRPIIVTPRPHVHTPSVGYWLTPAGQREWNDSIDRITRTTRETYAYNLAHPDRRTLTQRHIAERQVAIRRNDPKVRQRVHDQIDWDLYQRQKKGHADGVMYPGLDSIDGVEFIRVRDSFRQMRDSRFIVSESESESDDDADTIKRTAMPCQCGCKDVDSDDDSN